MSSKDDELWSVVRGVNRMVGELIMMFHTEASACLRMVKERSGVVGAVKWNSLRWSGHLEKYERMRYGGYLGVKSATII